MNAPGTGAGAPVQRAVFFGRPPSTVRGIVFMVVAALAFAAQAACVRAVSDELHAFEISFYRYLIGFLVFLPFVLRQGVDTLRTRRIGLHVVRGILGVISMTLFFWAVALIPIAKATALHFSSPIFAALLAVVLFREPLKLRRLLPLAIGFVGALIVLRPGVVAIDVGSLMSLGSAALFAVIMMMVKVLGRTDSSVAIAFYSGLVGLPFAAVATIPYWVGATADQWPALIGVGALGAAAQLALAQSLSEADATAVLPLDFTRLVFAGLLGYVFFAQVPDWMTLVGGLVIFAAATDLTLRERAAHRAATAAAAATMGRER